VNFGICPEECNYRCFLPSSDSNLPAVEVLPTFCTSFVIFGGGPLLLQLNGLGLMSCSISDASHCATSSILVISSLLGPIILIRTLFSNTLSLYSSLNVRDKVSHPYKTTGRIMVIQLYKAEVKLQFFLFLVLMFTFLDSLREDSELQGRKRFQI
jgi:hypothetical protein